MRPAFQGLVPVVEVVRSGRLESCHLGAAAVASASGELLAHAGDPELASYLRSAAKPVQLVAMLEAGLERRLIAEPFELALCAASHGGETAHVAAVGELLRRADLDPRLLRCGAHEPLDPDAARLLAAVGSAAEPLHNNCSGKHAAMLATCAANGWPLDSYLEPGHPLQVLITRRVAELSDSEPGVGVDGCGVPTFHLSLAAAARMLARLMGGARAPGPAARVVGAMTAHPWYTSGSRRAPYLLMRALPGLLAKEGAEGFFVLGLPAERSRWGEPVGVAVKVLDGAGEQARGREPGIASLLLSLGVARDAGERERLAELAEQPLDNVAGRRVGTLRGVLRLDA